MQCAACAAENPAENHFCDTCGAPLTVRCAQCGGFGRPGARFCGQCGNSLATPERPPTAPTAQQPAADTLPERGLTPHLGRERELNALADLFEQIKAREGRIALIAGEAGIGKSRLVHELRRRLALAGEEVTWLEGRCSPVGQAIPLLPVIEQVRESVGLAEPAGDDEIIATLDAGLDRLGELGAARPYLRSLLSIDPGDPDITVMDAAVRRTRTFDALRALAARVAQRRPVVLLFEDLQWIDRSSEDYLTTLLDALASVPILVIATARVGDLPLLAGRSDVIPLSLSRLSDADTQTMAGQMLGTANPPAPLTSALVARTGGVPLFVEEAVKALLSLGVLQHRGGSYAVTRSIDGRELPDSLERIITGRLDRLGESAVLTAQLAAVIGRDFSARALAPLVELPNQLGSLLAELQRHGIIDERRAAPEPVYAFRHAVIQQAVYHQLPAQRRKELHRIVGHALEEVYAERLHAYAAELGRHFSCGEQWAKALEYCERAGDQAAQADAPSEANQHYGRVLDAARHLRPPPESTRLAAWYAKRAAALHALDQDEDAIADAERALALVRGASDRHAELDTLIGLAELYYEAHRPHDALAHCDAAEEIATDLNDPRGQAACLASRALTIAAWQGPVADARRAARAALDLSEHVEHPALRARCLIVLGTLLQWRADFDACLPYLRDGAALARQIHAAELLGHVSFHLGHTYRSRGRYEQALRWYAEMGHHADEANDALWIARLPSAVAAVHLELNDLDAAIELCQEGDALAQRLSRWPEPRAHCLVNLGLAHVQRGELDAADASLGRAAGLLNGDAWGRWRWHMPLLRARAELALAAGRHDDAWSDATQALDLATQTDSRKHIAHVKLVLGEIAAAQDRLPEAEKLLRSAVTLADHIHAARELWRAGSALGRTLARTGREREAETYLTQAAQTIEAIAAELTDPALRASFTRATPVTEVYRLLGHRPLL